MRSTFLTLLGLLIAGSGQLTTARQDARSIVAGMVTQDRDGDATAEVRMEVVDSRGRSRFRTLTLWSRTAQEGERQQLIRFTAPADIRGTGFLSLQNGAVREAWLYLPALKRTRRIAGTGRNDRFVGTDFSFRDLEPERVDEYSYALVEETMLDSSAVWVVDARPGESLDDPYSRRRLWISKAESVLLRAEFHDQDDLVVKSYSASDVRQPPGSTKWRAHVLKMESPGEGTRTVLEITSYLLDTGLDSAQFTKRSLERGG